MITQNRQAALPDPKTNRLLAMLAPADFGAVIKESDLITLKLRTRLYQQDQRIDAVYFPLTSMVSLLVTTSDKAQMEMATIGKEGVAGASEVFHGQGAMGLNLVQIPGVAVRILAGTFKEIMNRRPAVQTIVHQHQFALTRQVLFGAACNRLHSMEERCSRWLLMTHDRAGEDSFPLTQEFLSHMLGVRRATVNVATGMLKKAGFIRYVRGVVRIVDRRGLESTSCECYRAIVKTYDAVLARTM